MFNKMPNSFWAELDEEYYKKFPEQWDQGDFYVHEVGFTRIATRETDRYERPRKKGETVDDKGIFRNGRYVWRVGREYVVKDHTEPLREVRLTSEETDGDLHRDGYEVSISDDNVLGRIRLVKIKRGRKKDVLVFEVV